MRLTAALVAAVVVAATMLLTLRLAGGRINAVVAGLLAATVGASPFIESFTLSGELLASLPAVCSLISFCAYLRTRQARWLLLAGALTGIAVLVK
jgi:4-amino-4-deoxy-L-arabinose transferase-like glycosyltransferase